MMKMMAVLQTISHNETINQDMWTSRIHLFSIQSNACNKLNLLIDMSHVASFVGKINVR